MTPAEKTTRSLEDKSTPEPNSGCWLWLASASNDGYGHLWDFRYKMVRYAHRVAYEIYRGKIPEGLTIDHLCRVRSCVNPDHLEAVPRLVNYHRGDLNQNTTKTHCPKGHQYDEANTYVRKDGARGCRECARLRMREKRGSKYNGNWNRERTHCIHGHPLSGDNLYIDKSTKKRVCRACSREKTRRYRQRQLTR
jgi:hypothetical protein